MSQADGAPNPGPWTDWKEFPAGVKEYIDAVWDRIPKEEIIENAPRFALEIRGTNPISGYRVHVV
jgi:hypothetical protein